jgi:2-iminobutanoate/2-iminopropanoate deaminase
METVRTSVPTMPPGPFAQGVRHGDILYVAGQVSYDGAAGRPVLGDIRVQTRQALTNLEAVLCAAGSSIDRIVKLNCILPNLPDDYVGFNEVFNEVFHAPYPARTTIRAGLLGGFLVEVEAVAVVDSTGSV